MTSYVGDLQALYKGFRVNRKWGLNLKREVCAGVTTKVAIWGECLRHALLRFAGLGKIKKLNISLLKKSPYFLALWTQKDENSFFTKFGKRSKNNSGLRGANPSEFLIYRINFALLLQLVYFKK